MTTSQATAVPQQPQQAEPKHNKRLVVMIIFVIVLILIVLGIWIAISSKTDRTADILMIPSTTLPVGITRTPAMELGRYRIEVTGKSETIPIRVGQCFEGTPGPNLETFYFPPGATEPVKYTTPSPEMVEVYFTGNGVVTFELKKIGTCRG